MSATGLVSPAMINKLRAVGNRQLVTDVTIQRQVKTQTPYGEQVSWTTIGTAKGWLRNMNTPKLVEQTGQIAAMTTYRLHLPQGTDILEADQVLIGGDAYMVQNVNQEDTLQIYTTAMMRRLE